MLAIVMKIFYLLFFFFYFFFYRKSSDCLTILEYSALSVLVAVISYSKKFFLILRIGGKSITVNVLIVQTQKLWHKQFFRF